MSVLYIEYSKFSTRISFLYIEKALAKALVFRYYIQNVICCMKITHGSDFMSIKKYEAFVITAKEGSLTKAASVLGTTQSRISHVLADLEEEYGFSLMNRGRGGIRLTEAGQLLYPIMEEILEKNRELESVVENIRQSTAGSVKLATFSSVAVQWLPGMLQLFQQMYPGVEVQMLSGDYDDIDQWLRTGEADLGFVTLPAPEQMQVIPLSEDPLVVILPEGHRLAALEKVPIDELRGEPFITLRQSSNHDIHRALDKAGLKPKVRYETKDDYALIAMVRQGLGISIVPQLLLGSRRDGIQVRQLDPGAKRTIALAISGKNPLPAVNTFVETAVFWLKSMEGKV